MTSPRAVLPVRALGLLAAAALGATVLAAPASAVPGSSWNRSSAPLVGVLDPGLPVVGAALEQVVVSGRRGAAAAADAVRRVGGT
ncbi:MAG: hypothetical protein JWN17_1107, partial [Frankiales bacterium]|nr:hypothetical protein [Frankiales bacterium]